MKLNYMFTLSRPVDYFTFRPRSAGFTLIELLVVIGLIGALAAGIGLSMRGGSPTSALRAGQSSLVGLVSSVRGQAALNQADAMIVVDVTDIQNENFLRSLQVVVRTQSGPDKWKPVGDPIVLPQGIYIVPPTNPAVPNAGSITMTGWAPERKSQGFSAVGGLTERTDSPYVATGAFTSKTYLQFIAFSALGTTSTEGTLLVTAGRRSAFDKLTFDNVELIRGVYVSRYGVPTVINQAATFDEVKLNQ